MYPTNSKAISRVLVYRESMSVYIILKKNELICATLPDSRKADVNNKLWSLCYACYFYLYFYWICFSFIWVQFLQRVFSIDTVVKPLPYSMQYNVSRNLSFFTRIFTQFYGKYASKFQLSNHLYDGVMTSSCI